MRRARSGFLAELWRRDRPLTAVCGVIFVALAGPLLTLPWNPAATDDAREVRVDTLRLTVGELIFDAVAAGPEDGPLVLLLHGFPQTSYEWRSQLPVLAAMGFRAVAPDQRGYSPGARPQEVAAYAIPELVSDIVGMAEQLGHERFHLVGHDWGAAVAWFTALGHPERVVSLVAVSVPHPFAFQEALQSPSGQQARMSGYMQTFRSDSAEAIFLRDAAAGLRQIYAGAGLTAADIQVYVDALGDSQALRAALNWYRAMSLGVARASVTPIRMPTTYVWSTEDVALGREGAELTAKYVEGPYRFEVLEGVSHWVPEEAAERLNEILQEHFAPYAP